MGVLQKIRYHYPRIVRQLGRRLRFGRLSYSLSGYHADRFACDTNDEPHLLRVLEKVLEAKAGAFLDVGANCGQTLVKVLAVDPLRSYFGFEPQISCCFYIEQFMLKNAISTATIVPVALSDVNSMRRLFWESPSDLTASFLGQEGKSGQPLGKKASWVLARRGDDLVRELGIEVIAAIKIDIEGAELEVLSGLKETITAQRPFVIFEVLRNYHWDELIPDPSVRRNRQDRADAIYRLLAELGYELFAIDRWGAEHAINGFDLDARPDKKIMNDGRDYIARPNVP
jgi:FkbM family methyltransferase